MEVKEPQERQTGELPKWEEIPIEKQREMIRILSEMIWRQMKREVSDEPQQDR